MAPRPLLFVGGSWHGRFHPVLNGQQIVEVQHPVMPQVPLVERYIRRQWTFGPSRTVHEAQELARHLMVLDSLTEPEVERMLGLLIIRWIDAGDGWH